ncbi:MAG: hypothetical protein AAGH41_02485 [Pseudomonadota bacterium]
MGFVFRLLAALVILAAIPVHALVPGIIVLGFVDQNYYEMLAGADPLITAYVDAGWMPGGLLALSTVCLIGALIGTLRGERWAASLILLTAVANAVSLYLANTLGFTTLPLSLLQIAGLGAGIVILFFWVRAVTRPV